MFKSFFFFFVILQIEQSFCTVSKSQIKLPILQYFQMRAPTIKTHIKCSSAVLNDQHEHGVFFSGMVHQSADKWREQIRVVTPITEQAAGAEVNINEAILWTLQLPHYHG